MVNSILAPTPDSFAREDGAEPVGVGAGARGQGEGAVSQYQSGGLADFDQNYQQINAQYPE